MMFIQYMIIHGFLYKSTSKLWIPVDPPLHHLFDNVQRNKTCFKASHRRIRVRPGPLINKISEKVFAAASGRKISTN